MMTDNYIKNFRVICCGILLLLNCGLFAANSLSSSNDFSNSTYATTPSKTFVVIKGAGTKDAELATTAVEKADMEIFRLRSSRRTIAFKSGVVIELLSADEMKAAGFDVDPAHYTLHLPDNYKEPVYDIAVNGQLIQYFESAPAKK